MIYKFYDAVSAQIAKNEKNTKAIISSIDFTPPKYLTEYDIYNFSEDMVIPIEEKNIELTNEMKILACALAYDCRVHPDETIFVTTNKLLAETANLFFGEDSIQLI